MIEPLPVSQLANRCRDEAKRYQQTGQSDETYCFELFRLALVKRDEVAWQALYDQYRPLAVAWVYHYSRFSQTNEEADFFINEAFTRLWHSGSESETRLMPDSLGKCLSFLRACVWSAIEDYLRKIERDILKNALSLEDFDQPVSRVELELEHTLSLQELRQALWEVVQDDRERLVAEASWVYGFTPRQIQANHPEIFATVEEISQIKHNLLKRLRRYLKR